MLRVRRGAVCRLCKRELEAEVVARANGHVEVAFRCPRHGALNRGEKYLTGIIAEECNDESNEQDI